MNSFLSELAALKFTPWYRWHPQLAIRYLPVVEEIRENLKCKMQNAKLGVLEVGSGGLGIAPYLKMPVIGVDVKFEAPIYPLLRPIVGDAVNLKFGDDSFGYAVGIDMLEHLPKAKRGKAIGEMLRVAKREVIIGIPCGNEAREHDQKMAEIYASKNYSGFKFMDEHQELGLPEEADILSYIKEAAERLGKKVKIRVEGNMNIKMREFLMKGWMNSNPLVDLLFRKFFLLFVPVFRILDKPPYYRQLFFITL